MAFTEPPELYTRPDGTLVPDVIIRQAFFRNNLTIGGTGSGVFGPGYSNGTGLAARWPTLDQSCDFNFNGYGTHGTPFQGDIAGKWFDSLESLRSNTMEKNGVQVGMDIFAAEVPFPDPPIPSRDGADLRLRPLSAAVDAGEFIPNINTHFNGSAPDLGAFELGQKIPHYGPRPEGLDEETMDAAELLLSVTQGPSGAVTLEWSGGGRLQESNTLLTGDWTVITNATSPYIVPTTGTAKFFRLER
jgi:hypothetical protein